jgi:hypothetical protein
LTEVAGDDKSDSKKKIEIQEIKIADDSLMNELNYCYAG